MRIDEFWKTLQGYGVEVPPEVQYRIGLDLCQERIMIRPPQSANKTRVLEYGTTVSAVFIARQLGITVQHEDGRIDAAYLGQRVEVQRGQRRGCTRGLVVRK